LFVATSFKSKRWHKLSRDVKYNGTLDERM